MSAVDRSRSPPRRAGKYDESFEHTSALCLRLEAEVGRMSSVKAEIVTDYSGIGGAEMGLAFVKRALSARGCKVEFSVFRSCDVQGSCRQVLVNHATELCPKHVQGDMRSRVTKQVVEEMASALAKHCELGSKDRDTMRATGKAFLQECLAKVKAIPESEDVHAVHCYTCGKCCPIFPEAAVT
eukprot:6458993-Amphidinium_carterae.5